MSRMVILWAMISFVSDPDVPLSVAYLPTVTSFCGLGGVLVSVTGYPTNGAPGLDFGIGLKRYNQGYSTTPRNENRHF